MESELQKDPAQEGGAEEGHAEYPEVPFSGGPGSHTACAWTHVTTVCVKGRAHV